MVSSLFCTLKIHLGNNSSYTLDTKMMCTKRGLPISCPIMFTTLVHKVTSLYPQYFLIIICTIMLCQKSLMLQTLEQMGFKINTKISQLHIVHQIEYTGVSSELDQGQFSISLKFASPSFIYYLNCELCRNIRLHNPRLH